MAYPAALLWLPLASAVVWFGLVLYQLWRDRFRTWTEVFFLASAFFLGLYALSDFYFFTTPGKEEATLAALASFTSLSLAGLFFMLFGVVFYTRMRNVFFLALVPQLLFLPYLWTHLIKDLVPLEGTGPPYSVDYGGDRTLFMLWVGLVLVYVAIGAWAFYRTFREVAKQQTKLTRRMRGMMIAIVLTVLLAASTNVIRPLLGAQIPSLFSSALLLPGAVAFVALSPLSKERLSLAVLRWKSRRYEIKAAFVIYQDGTLIAAKVAPGEKVIDQDLFSGTLDVIQNFMRTSFPSLRGPLKAIAQGNYTLVVERGHWAYLTLVIEGEETDQLRRQMRDGLLKFEQVNRTTLAHWQGVPTEAKGTDDMLLEFFLAPE